VNWKAEGLPPMDGPNALVQMVRNLFPSIQNIHG